MRLDEALDVGARRGLERCLPGRALGAELRGQVGDARRLVVELAERPRAEDAVRVPDAIEQTQVRLVRLAASSRPGEERIDERGRIAALGGSGARRTPSR